MSASVRGEDVLGVLKYESGVHRVQRVPSTESMGRVHTSTSSVAVLLQPTEVHTHKHSLRDGGVGCDSGMVGWGVTQGWWGGV